MAQITECLETGVDVSAITSRNRTVFHLAVQKSENPLIVAALIEAGAEVNAAASEGYAPLFMARNADVIEVLVEAGADIEARFLNSRTPLIHAVRIYADARDIDRAKSFEIIRLLLELGANVNAQNYYGESVLHIIARYAQFEKVDFSEVFQLLIVNGADTEISTYPMWIDSFQPTYTALHLLLSSGSGGEDEAYLLLALGADPKAITGGSNQSTAYQAVCRNEYEYRHIFPNESDMLETLLDLDVDPTIMSANGMSAIGRAFFYECYEDIRLFRKYGYLDRQPALTYE